MKFSDSKMLHGVWAEQIATHLSAVDVQDENHCRSLPFLLASKGTQELAEHFEQTYHLTKRNRLASARSRETFLALGGNYLHLANPVIVMLCYDTEMDEERSLTISIESTIPLPIQYMDIDVAVTKRHNGEGTYYGPHVLGVLSLGTSAELEGYEVSAGDHTVLVPFYSVEVADTQPTGAFN